MVLRFLNDLAIVKCAITRCMWVSFFVNPRTAFWGPFGPQTMLTADIIFDGCSNVCNMVCQISYGFMLWKAMMAMGSKRAPEANNVSFLGCSSKVKWVAQIRWTKVTKILINMQTKSIIQ